MAAGDLELGARLGKLEAVLDECLRRIEALEDGQDEEADAPQELNQPQTIPEMVKSVREAMNFLASNQEVINSVVGGFGQKPAPKPAPAPVAAPVLPVNPFAEVSNA